MKVDGTTPPRPSTRRAPEETREARLRELRARIRSGAYQPDPQRLAEELLRAAEDGAQPVPLIH